MHPHRRHRTGIAKPVKRSIQVDLDDDDSKDSPVASRGISSFFARARRRWGGNSREADTLLPTTFSPPIIPPKRASMSPSAKTCNSFLMGGHYYPGKDKKRRHMRRRTLWYRIFCSSPGRKVASFLVFLYLFIYHGLFPAGAWLFEIGKALSSDGGRSLKPNWLQYDSTLVIPILHEEKNERERLVSERARLQYGSPNRNHKRLEVLQNVAPRWFARNNPDPQHEDQVEDPSKTEKKKDNGASPDGGAGLARKEIISGGGAKNGKPAEKKTPKVDQLDTPDTRSLQVFGEKLPDRTLDTMESLTGDRSSCKPVSEPDWSTTLVVQTSISRLWILSETCAHWNDPIIAVVFVPHGEQKPSWQVLCEHVSVVYYMASEEESTPDAYPVNRLRNVGLDLVDTSHVLVVDIDFVPSLKLSDVIRKTLKEHYSPSVTNGSPSEKQAIVVPAFERLPPQPCESEADCASYLKEDKAFLPSTFEQLQDCVKNGGCIVFQSKVNWEGHYSTNSAAWLKQHWYRDEAKTKLVEIPCFHTPRYEPYLVLRWCPSPGTPSNGPVTPYYDERFHGYGKNKIEMVSHLRKTGYRFSVLPEGFIVHNPHPESKTKNTWNDRGGSDLHSSMDKLYSSFLRDLDSRYKDIHESTVKLCKKKV